MSPGGGGGWMIPGGGSGDGGLAEENGDEPWRCRLTMPMGGWLEWLEWLGVMLEVTLDAWRHPSRRHTYKMRAQTPRWKIHKNTTAPYARAPCNITTAP
jgi:hypothetical protein